MSKLVPCPVCGRLILDPVELHPVHVVMCEGCGNRIARLIPCEWCGQDRTQGPKREGK